MQHKTSVFILMAATLSFVYATLSLQGAVIPIIGSANPTAIILKIKDQKNILLKLKSVVPASFWYELVIFSKKSSESIAISDIIGIENDESIARFIMYNIHRGVLGFMRATEKNKEFSCPIRRTPRSGGAYATLTFQAPCGTGSGEHLENIEILLIKATSMNEKYIILKNAMRNIF